MKYAILLTKNTDNIGDDIQSYAQKRFLPSVDYVIDREEMNTFGLLEENDEPVSVIMNAWYMYQKFNWPPSRRINPLFVSMHITKNDYFGIGDRFLDGLGGDYLRQHGPIGARDESTLRLLQGKGIDAYLSGCLTLTLSLPEPEAKTDEVILVDVNADSAAELQKQFPHENWAEVTHSVDCTVYAKKTLDERFEAVETLLKRYQRAKCVVTERLHCALPCLALGVPVLLLYRSEYMERMSSFLPLLHSEAIDEVQAGVTNYDISQPPANPASYLEYRQSLERTCEEFIQRTQREKTELSPMPALEQLFTWQTSMLNSSEVSFRSIILEQQKWIKELEDAKQWLDTQYQEQQKWIRELEEAKQWFLGQIDLRDKEIARRDEEIAALKRELKTPWYKKKLHN